MSWVYTLHYSFVNAEAKFWISSKLCLKTNIFANKCCLKIYFLKEIHGFASRFNPRYVMSSPKTHWGNLLKFRPCKNSLTDFCTSECLTICKSSLENFHMVSILDLWCLTDLAIKDFLKVSRRISNWSDLITPKQRLMIRRLENQTAEILPDGTSKVHIFWEGHKNLRNLHLTFVYSTYRQK